MWKKWLSIDFVDENKFRLFLTKIFMMIGIVALTYFSLRGFIVLNYTLAYALLFFEVLLILCFIYIQIYQNHVFAGHSVSTLMLLLTIFLIYTGGENLTGPLWAYTVPVVSFATTGKRVGLIHTSILFLFMTVAFVLLPQYFPPYNFVFKLRLYISLLVNTLLLFFFEHSRSAIYRNMVRSQDEKIRLIDTIKNQNDELQEQKQSLQMLNYEIEQKNIFITDSIKYAQRIQTSVMPLEESFRSIFDQYFILNYPKNIISGDFYYLHQNNNFITFALGDCSGHGVPGAYLSLISLVFLDQIHKINPKLDITEKLNWIESQILQLLKIEQSEFNNDSIDISLCQIHPDEKILRISLVNQDMILQLDNGEIQTIYGQPFSLCDRQANELFTVQQFSFKHEFKLVLFTDGFADQLNQQSRKFSKKRFYKLIEQNIHHNFEQLKNTLVNEHKNWKGNTKQTDDICIIGLHYSLPV